MDASPSCGEGLSFCGDRCVATASDPAHCGACGAACALAGVSEHACVSARCEVVRCANGRANCDGVATNGCETAINAADVNNCGGCGIRCAFANASARCDAGSCVMGACAPGFADCDGNPANGCEVNTGSDNANCGACGRACGAGRVCSMGTCAVTCGAGTTNCSGDCVRTASDPNHCGACGAACALANVSVQACGASNCVVGACSAGFGNCDGVAANGCETNLRVAQDHCGACGNRCVAPATCVAGACVSGEMVAGFSRGRGGSWLSQSAARAECLSRGGDLAWIQSAAENAAVSSVCAQTDGGPGPHHGCWIGGSHSGMTNTWLNGATWTYENWAPGEPSDPISAVWIYSSPSPAPSRWDDFAAGFMTSFVCRLPRSADSTGAAAVVNL